ncbi:unnamed protein product [Closterium sp. NIES-54]
MFITLYFIVTCLPDSLCAVKEHFLALDPTDLTADLLEQHLLAVETSVVAVGAARGTPRMPFFEGCSPSPLAPSYASAAAVDVLGAEDVGAAFTSKKRRSSKGKGGRGGGGGSGGGGGGSSGGGGVCGSGGGCGGFGGGSGSSGGGGGSGGSGSGGGRAGAVLRGGSGGGHRQQQQRRSKTPSPQQLREWFSQRGASGGSGSCPYVIRTGDHAELLRSGVAIFDLDYDAILAAMYALSVSANGDCYLCVLPDLGIEAAALGVSEFALPGTAPAQALHTFTLDSGASRYFFRDSTTLTLLSAPVPVRLADPSRGPVLARSSTILPCPAVSSCSVSGLHLPSFSTNLVSIAALQDSMVTTTTPGGQHVSICMCTRTGRHLATFTRRPGSSLYTMATEPSQVAASAQVSASPPPLLPCVEGRQRAAPHSSSFPPTTAPLQTLHMDVWGPARVSGQGRERYFLLVVDDYTRYTTVFPLRPPLLLLTPRRATAGSCVPSSPPPLRLWTLLVSVPPPSRTVLPQRPSPLVPPPRCLLRPHCPPLTAALQDSMVTTTTPGGQRVWICTCTRTGRHLATFTRRPGSSLYTLATEPSQVAASAQMSAPGPVARPCSCRLLSQPTLLWNHRLGHPSPPRLRGMRSRLLVSGLPRSLPPLPPLPAHPCLPCIEGRQRAAPHSSSFPPTIPPLQTLHMDVWGPARVIGHGRVRYFLLVVDDYTRYTTVFPLRSNGEVPDVLIPWIRAVRLQLHERLREDLPVLCLHSDRGGEFSSDLLRDFCRREGILQSFTLPASPQQNRIAEHRIGLVMEVARTSMIHAAAPHFLWPFAVRYTAHQLNLWPRVSLPETSSTLRWTGKVGDALVFWVWGSRAFVRDTSADKLSARAIPCDVTFDELVPFYRLFLYRSAPPPPPPLFLALGPPPVDPLPPQGLAPSGVSQIDPLPSTVPVEGARSGGAKHGGAELAGVEHEGAEPEGVEPGCAESEGAESGGAEPRGTASFGGAGDSAAGDTGAGGVGATRLEGAGVTAGAGGTGGAAAAGPGGARTRGTGAAGTGSVGGAGAGGAGGGDPAKRGGAGVGAAGARDTGARGARAGAAGAVDPGAGGAGAGGVVSGGTGEGGTSIEPESPPASPIHAARTGFRVPRPRPPPIPGTRAMALRPSSVPLRVPLPPPRESSLPAVPDPESELAHAASPIVSRLLATVVTDPSFESLAASALIAELVDFAAACRLDYATALVAESGSANPLSLGGECALGTDVLEDKQEDFECLATAVPLVAMLLPPEGDTDAPDIPTPHSYAEAITGTYSSQWQTAMDAEMASWKSTGTYVDAVPPSGANIVDDMWIFRVKRPPGSPPAFKALYVARGFSQRQGVDYFQTFSPTPKMTTLRVLLHVAAQRDYELHCLDLSTTFLQGSLQEEIWPRRPPSFTGSFPAGTQSFSASWVDDLVTQRSSQGYTFSLGYGSVSWQSTRSSSVLSSSCEAEIYAGAMAAQELRGLTYLLTGLGEQPCSPPFLLGSGAVSSRSTRSSSVASSSAKAEIYAGAMAAQELRWLTYLLTGLGEQPSSTLTLFADNKAMILLCREPLRRSATPFCRGEPESVWRKKRCDVPESIVKASDAPVVGAAGPRSLVHQVRTAGTATVPAAVAVPVAATAAVPAVAATAATAAPAMYQPTGRAPSPPPPPPKPPPCRVRKPIVTSSAASSRRTSTATTSATRSTTTATTTHSPFLNSLAPGPPTHGGDSCSLV